VKQKISGLLLPDSRQGWKVAEKTLLIVVLLDLALGGNGYLVQIGGLRLRVILYGFCMAWVILRLTRIQPIRLDAPLIYMSVFFAAPLPPNSSRSPISPCCFFFSSRSGLGAI
jgi:hypothetical protein